MAEEKDIIRRPSGENLSPEQKFGLFHKGGEEEPIEKKEPSAEENIIREAIKKEIELMESDDSLKEEAAQKAKKIQTLGEAEKIEHLLGIAKEKGVIFAIKTAKQMNDNYTLDIFHDILVNEWPAYREFLK